MSSRPSRTTRSSAAAASTAPATRSTRASSAAPAPPPPSTNTSRPVRTTRASRSTTPALAQEIKPVPSTRASLATRSTASSRASSLAGPPPPTSSKPLWGRSAASTAQNGSTETPPPKRQSSLAVPGSAMRTKTPGLLKKMTSRESLRPGAPKTPAASQAQSLARTTSGIERYDGAREPIKAYLRIRPAPPGVPLQSYVQVLNDTEVLMVPPLDHRLNPSSSSSSIYSNALLRNTSHQRLSNLHLDPSSHPSGVPNDVCASPAPTQQQQPDPASYGALYKFTGVYPSTASPSSPTSPSAALLPPTDPEPEPTGLSQSSFFSLTALPLVRSFLEKGENCLLFAYGPTGSGKTFTVQGGQGDDAGLLPRIVEVVWGSLKGKGKPASPGANGPHATQQPLQSTPVKPSLRGLGAKESLPMRSLPEWIPVDDGYEYAVYVSYSEIYNEKIYDLLESPLPAPAPSTSSTTSATGGGGGGGMLKGLFRNFTTVKRSALSLKADKTAPTGAAGATKVVGGLREVRVGSAEEAHRVLHQGQSNRRVFSTLANRASSRSHSIFTIKLVRTPRSGTSATHPAAGEVTSKFSVVDLAGSERVVNTQTTGERLKEAGNINKSLMVLGQCMEVLRKNQERGEGRKPAIVPFRHSKLTEMFQSFFIGEGKAVMIVNINPYSTSFDENSHVMKFSAVARGVMTVQRSGNALVLPSTREQNEDEEAEGEKSMVKNRVKNGEKKRESVRRVVRMSLVEGGEEEEVVYEEEDLDEEDEDEDEFVNALLDELSALRTALFEAQMDTVLAEANARKRVVQEYERKMLDMERMYQERMREEAIEAENKLNAKLDILTRLQAAKTPARNAMIDRLGSMTPSTVYDDSDEDGGEGEEQEGEESGEEEEDGEVEKMLLKSSRAGDASSADSAASASPLAARVKVQISAAQRSLTSPAAASPIRLTANTSASITRSPLAASQSHVEHHEAEEQEEEDAPEADSSFAHAHSAQADSSIVKHNSSRVEGQEDGDASYAATEQTVEEDDEEEEQEESVVNLSRLTEEMGLGDEGEQSVHSMIDDEAEEDSREEGELTEVEEDEEEDDEEQHLEADEQDQPHAGEEEEEDDGPFEPEDEEYVSEDAAEEELSDNDDEFEPSPIPSPGKKQAASSSSSPSKRSTPAPSTLSSRAAQEAPEADADESFDSFSPVKTPAHAKPSNGNGGKENAAPYEMATPVHEREEEEGEADEFGERSMVIRSGSKTKKTKRKLGVKKTFDADELDSFAEGVVSPVRKTPRERSFRQY
ncbi:hypothetical protein JCM8547_006766 [Rhodosporidiobolus lusitaniae]